MKRKPINIEEHRGKLFSLFMRLGPKTPANELQELVDQFEIGMFSKREIVLQAGEFSDTVYFIVSGLEVIVTGKQIGRAHV